MRNVPLSLGVAAVVGLGALAAPARAAEPTTWYVEAGARSGDGSQDAPLGSLVEVEQLSAAGDRIVVLPAAQPLDGGIRLKPRQVLVGGWLTNTTTRLEGDAVRLADGAQVRAVRITDTRRGAIYGSDVSGVSVIGNDISGQNADCVPGFLIPPFNAPTNVPGVGIPISHGLQNGWAAIQVDAERRQDVTALIAGNEIHDADCGDGIDVRLSGDARGSVVIRANDVRMLRQGPDFQSLLAIGVQARDTAVVHATIDGNVQADLGNADDLNLITTGADSEGVFLNAVGPATLDAVVSENDYTNEEGIGGFSANGLEMVSMGRGARMSALVSDSTFSGAPGDLIEHGALGTDAVMTMRLVRVVAERSTGVGNTYLLPFNNGDCVLAGSLGARNIVRLVVRRSVLRNCANNGLSLGSNVVNGTGATTEVSADVRDSVITGNRGGNVGIRNFTRLGTLRFRMERTDLQRSKSLGSGVADFSAEDVGTTAQHTIDIGGGALASDGENCLRGGLLAANVVRYRVSARRNWWGRAGGPGPLRTLVVLGALDTGEPLATAPRAC
ncbi:hypothetical protein D0Z08_23400 [Nocardioides immobilis]|uniref:Right-handed parallel beta-helix repeat-containing protein n=1 Tax=Nocardioides immobilis TaxID=2049295 RepID=A0A417XWI5_9ACTN|nr:hypothetical protein [Nocardioides immobilis]RHW24675.1 hypothetical protein D0Z08_23400 [Nocardioides immobilis]